jgi:hypothetical protein
MFSPYSDDSSSNYPVEKSPQKKIRKMSKVSTQQRKLSTTSKGKTHYNQRKDVIFKRILRGCRKYYYNMFATFSKNNSRNGGHFKDDT